MASNAKSEPRGRRLEANIASFLQNHRTEIQNITSAITNIFEAFCYVVVVKYYADLGYRIEPDKLLDGKFRFKYSTAGNPWNFSFFRVCNPQTSVALFEIRHNLKIVSSWTQDGDTERDKALFAVDIAIVNPDRVPNPPIGTPRGGSVTWLENENLLTFGEVKKLVAYPMLLAQFLGIVHELQPQYIGLVKPLIAGSAMEHHPPPILFTDGHISLGSKKVIESFVSRGFQLTIIANVTTLSDADVINQLRASADAVSSSRTTSETKEAEDVRIAV